MRKGSARGDEAAVRSASGRQSSFSSRGERAALLGPLSLKLLAAQFDEALPAKGVPVHDEGVDGASQLFLHRDRCEPATHSVTDDHFEIQRVALGNAPDLDHVDLASMYWL
jgi:hypothetical protein